MLTERKMFSRSLVSSAASGVETRGASFEGDGFAVRDACARVSRGGWPARLRAAPEAATLSTGCTPAQVSLQSDLRQALGDRGLCF
jgi:hypothetical protein